MFRKKKKKSMLRLHEEVFWVIQKIFGIFFKNAKEIILRLQVT